MSSNFSLGLLERVRELQDPTQVRSTPLVQPHAKPDRESLSAQPVVHQMEQNITSSLRAVIDPGEQDRMLQTLRRHPSVTECVISTDGDCADGSVQRPSEHLLASLR
jgi:hypothetical protein